MKYNITKDFLQKKYIEENLGLRKVAKFIGCNHSTVKFYVEKHGLKLHKSGTHQSSVKGLTALTSNVVKAYSPKFIEKNLLEDLYIKQGLTCSEIGKQLNCGRVTVYKYLKKYDLKTRLRSERNEKYLKNLSLASGGTGIPYENNDYPKEFNQDLKEKLRFRDNYQCQNPNCGITEEEHIIVFGEVLTIHHIDYNKQNCQENNLITCCRACNARFNFNRSYWQEILTSKILLTH